jgi:protoporphyrinogen/coproporphyrinogen III oxidase
MSESPSHYTSSVAVIGAGIAGLAAAWTLRQRGIDVTVFEASDRAGGVIESVEREGFTLDLGPNTVVARTHVLPDLVQSLGLESELVRASGATRRFVVREGRPMPLPSNPLALLSTRLLSARGKLRLLGEPFAPRNRQPGAETVASFVRRRLGQEVLDYAVDPFVAGVFAGDPERLVVEYAFPMLPELEREHGSLLRGGIERRRAAPGRSGTPVDRRPFSFTGGAATLTETLAARLASDLHLSCAARAVVSDSGRYRVIYEHNGASVEHVADAVVLALPSYWLATISLDGTPALPLLSGVPTPPVTVLCLGFRREQVEHPLDGFGMLIPRVEPFRILGALFSSSLFPERAPDGHVLLTCFLGGSRRPADALLAEREQVAIAMDDLRVLLGASGEPVLTVRRVWERAIPQYDESYPAARAAMEAFEERHPRLAIAGSIRRGISVGDAATSGVEAANRLAAALAP